MALNNLLLRTAKVAVRMAIAATATPATIRRGAESHSITAIGRGRSQSELETASEVVGSEEHREQFIVWPADYQFGATAVEPELGDTFEIDDGATVATYEVNPQPPDPAWRWTDRFRTAYRVNAVLISETES